MIDRYKTNLKVEGDKVYSYNTHVATINGTTLNVHGWWSQTTTKHVNYVAKTLNLNLEQDD